MRILGCHISGFGCFSDETFSFEDGVNTVLKENGYGKTTLLAFFRVMLYGFMNEGKRTGRERDLRRPWQGGVYGGTLDLAAGEKKYRIERTFGLKPQEDALSVFDLSTRILTEELGETPGKALFDVDGETFERTVYLSDSSLDTHITDGVHAKLGDLVEDTVDVNRYQEADELIKNLLNQWSETRTTGELYGIGKRITELEQALRAEESTERNLNTVEQSLRDIRQEKEKLRTEEEEVTRKQGVLSKYQTISEKKVKFDGLKADYEDRSATKKRIADTLPLGVPVKEELEETEKALSRYEAGLESSARETLSDEEQADLMRYEAEFARSSVFPGEGEELLSVVEESEKTAVELTGRKASLEKARKEYEEKLLPTQKRMRITCIMGFVLVALGIVMGILTLAVYHEMLYGVLAILLAVCGSFIVTLYWIFKKNTAGENGRREAGFTEEEENLKTESEALEEARKKISAFLSRFGAEDEKDRASAAITRILRDQDAYNVLKEKNARVERNRQETAQARIAVRAYLLRYVALPGDDFRAELNALEDRMERYQTAEEEFVRSGKALREFKEQEDVTLLEEAVRPDFPEDLNTLNERLEAIRSRTGELSEAERDYEKETERLRGLMQDFADREEELRGLTEKRTALREKVSVYQETRGFLARAKQSFSAKYTDPVADGFRKYAAMILGESPLEFDVSADGYAIIRKNGLTREIDLFSSGYQTLTYFALRLSLADAMYEGEKPVLFLDDPFSSLDDEKLSRAIALMKKAGERYQILYFTCHKSRA